MRDNMKRIAIVGSRNYPNKQLVIDFISNLPQDTILISGGAKGVDSWAEDEFKNRGMRTEIYHADWYPLGIFDRSAGFKRNYVIVQNADEIVAFLFNDSRGTSHSIRVAREQNKPVTIIDENGNLIENVQRSEN